MSSALRCRDVATVCGLHFLPHVGCLFFHVFPTSAPTLRVCVTYTVYVLFPSSMSPNTVMDEAFSQVTQARLPVCWPLSLREIILTFSSTVPPACSFKETNASFKYSASHSRRMARTMGGTRKAVATSLNIEKRR